MIFGGEVILICRKYLGGMIFVGEIDPDLMKSFCRDDFRRVN